MATLKIPDRFKKALITISLLEDAAVQELATALGKGGCSVLSDEMSSGIAKQTAGSSFKDARALVDALLSLYVLKANTNRTSEKVAQDVAYTLASEGAASEAVDTEKQRHIADKLNRLLSVEAMDMCAKATGLQAEFGRVFVDSRVVTDVRPVFGSSVESPPIGAVLIHNLKVEYVERGVRRELFFALDCNDISGLMGVLERAKEKERTLRSSLASWGLTVIGSEEGPKDGCRS
jgi:hypothetical protein